MALTKLKVGMATSNRLTEYPIERPEYWLPKQVVGYSVKFLKMYNFVPEENFYANQTLQVIKCNPNIAKVRKLPKVSQTIHSLTFVCNNNCVTYIIMPLTSFNC